jgi:hypothetical protein
MQGRGGTGTRRSAKAELSIPDELARRLRPWIDVEAVGPEGFWTWLGTVMPLLVPPSAVSQVTRDHAAPELSERRMQELARDLVDCARDRSRLTTMAARYYNDNVALARRVKALEAALSTSARTKRTAPAASDADAGEAAERYLPRL